MKNLIYFSFSFFLLACSANKTVTQLPQQNMPSTLPAVTVEPEKIEKTESIKESSETEINTINITKEPVSETNSTEETVNKDIAAPHKLWNELLQKHVSDAGHVNYKTFKTERSKLLSYIQDLNLIYSDDSFKSLSKEEALAFWINAYNAMTVDLILRNYPIKSIKDIDKPWDQRYWKLGEKWFNLNDIEHEILRKMDEPRIHFAIVCASVSCPKLQNTAFTASNIETQLTYATKEFLSDPERNEISENSIKISKIFQWFSKDFKKNGDLIDFLNQYSDVEISAKAKKSFKDYNWNLNE
ncbi:MULTISPECIES: DUF547 domain-containing protein [unclassified Algibacter]|uniref:DUF547 domain-containing protein n=1 Tax=unclassified Algibacter TaxID=2615009 RepID=UPI00131B2E1D|nr:MULTISPECIES: DUF547 domain-containing protein [unclassified Algibacter]MCL5128978.1 DUF547 domain-containing protein [Algibacter sp. L4_22]